jgi:hypothetical protein
LTPPEGNDHLILEVSDKSAIGIAMLLFGGLYGYAYYDARSDQWKELTRSINMCSTDQLTAKLRSGEINRDDFPDALFLWIKDDYPTGVQKLLELGARTDARNTDGLDPYEYAAKLHRAEILQLMIDKDFDGKRVFRTPRQTAR